MPTIAEQWQAFSQGLPADIPDTAYDSVREQYFRSRVLPVAYAAGEGESESRERFWKVSERVGKASMPKLQQMGAAALEAFTAPMRGLSGTPREKDYFASLHDATKTESGRQGVSQVVPEMAGAVAGTLPYFLPVARGAKALAGLVGGSEALAVAQANRALQTTLGAAAAGAYETAKHADQGREVALHEGLKGLAMGAAFVGALEYMGPMWRALRASSRVGLTVQEAKSVEAMVKGLADEAQTELATAALAKEPQLIPEIQKVVQAEVEGARQAGLPKMSPKVTPAEKPVEPSANMSGRGLSVVMQTPGGGEFTIANTPSVEQAAIAVKAQLARGATVVKQSGSEEQLHQLMKQVEGMVPEEVPVVEVKPTLPKWTPPILSGTPVAEMSAEAHLAALVESGLKKGQKTALAKEVEGMSLDDVLEVGPKQPIPKKPVSQMPEVPVPEAPPSVPPKWVIPEALPEPGNYLHPHEQMLPPAVQRSILENRLKNRLQRARTVTKQLEADNTFEPEAEALVQEVEGIQKQLARMEEAWAAKRTAPQPVDDVAEKLAASLRALGKEPPPVVEPPSLKPVEELSISELDDAISQLKGDDATLLETLFGREGAKAYNRLQRIANSSTRSDKEVGAATDELAKMEEALTEVQRNRLFGIGDTGYNLEQLQEIRQGIGQLDATSPETLGESLKWAVSKFDPANPKSDLAVYAQLRAAHQLAAERGWSTAEVMAHAYKGVAGRFRDMDDAAFMLEKFKKPATAPVANDASVPGLTGRPPSGSKFDIGDVSPSQRLQQRPGGGVLDTMTGKHYGSMIEALEQTGNEVLKTGPLGIRKVTDVPEGFAGMYDPLTKTTTYYKPLVNKSVVFHEQTHAMFDQTGLLPTVETVGGQPMAKKLLGAYTPAVRDFYTQSGTAGEEVLTKVMEAIRTKNTVWLERFGRADDGVDNVVKWATEQADGVLGQLDFVADSVAARRLQARMVDLKLRGKSLVEMDAQLSRFGGEVQQTGKGWQVSTPTMRRTFDTWDSVVNFVQKTFGEPLHAPELVDTSLLPEGLRRSVGNMLPPSKVPRFSIPETPAQPAKTQGGFLGALLRPKEQWIASFALKNKMPELYDAYRAVKEGGPALSNEFFDRMAKLRVAFGDGLKDVELRRKLAEYRQAGRTTEAAEKLGLRPQDVALEKKLHAEFVEPLSAELGVDLTKFESTFLPRLRASQGNMGASELTEGLTPKEATFFKKMGTHNKGQDFLRNLQMYARESSTQKGLSALNRLEDLINQGRIGDHSTLNMLQRYVDHMRGIPDESYGVVRSFLDDVVGKLRAGVEQANKHLPPGKQLDWFSDTDSLDLLNKYMILNYASSMARPMSWIRDGSQLFMTTLPILGFKYTIHGLRTVIGAAKDKSASEVWQIARQYGAVYEHNPLADILSGTQHMSGTQGPVMRVAHAALKPMEWVNNVNRLASFWGHAKKAQDAFAQFGDNAEAAVTEAGGGWLPELSRLRYVGKYRGAGTPEARQEVAYQMAKDLTDLSQWSYSKGETPGLYQYTMGRLFGMYGTWPLNYIEYARMLGTRVKQEPQALARLVGVHYAILAAGQGVGIDTASWVFTGPAGFGESPLAKAVTSAPTAAFDWESRRGAEARGQLGRAIFPMSIPGGMQMEALLRAIKEDDGDNAFKLMWGFTPMKPGESDRGIHNLVPEGR